MKRICALITLLAIAGTSMAQTAQKVKVLQLKNEKMRYAPKDHYFNIIKDERTDTSNIGYIKTGFSEKTTTLKLKYGTENAVRLYIQQNMRQDTTTQPVELRIVELSVSEKRTSGVEKAELSFAFDYYVGGEKLLRLSSSAYVRSGLDATLYIEEMIRQQTESGLEQFGQWWSENKNVVLATPKIVVEATVDLAPTDEDYFAYSKKMPLSYSDFKGTPDKLSLAAAATYSGVSLEGSTHTLNKEVTLKLKIGAFFNQERSWFKADAKKQYVLDHEQIHFDITACIACEFLHTVRDHTFSVDNYKDELELLRKNAERLVQRTQDEYDEETNHGTIEKKQLEWKNKIAERMKNQDCYQ